MGEEEFEYEWARGGAVRVVMGEHRGREGISTKDGDIHSTLEQRIARNSNQK